MAITVSCDNPSSGIITLTIEGEWTWDEALSALSEAVMIASQAGRKMHCIYDLSRNSYMPPTGLIPAIQEGVGMCVDCGCVSASLFVFNRAQGQFRTMLSTALERYGAPGGMYLYFGSLAEALSEAQRRVR